MDLGSRTVEYPHLSQCCISRCLVNWNRHIGQGAALVLHPIGNGLGRILPSTSTRDTSTRTSEPFLITSAILVLASFYLHQVFGAVSESDDKNSVNYE